RERRRIGHDLHDTLCQHLTATSLSLQVLSDKLADASLPQAKDADASLRASWPKVCFRWNWRGKDWRVRCKSSAGARQIAITLSANSAAIPQTATLDSTTATYLYRIVQEAVTNAVKHGHISEVNVGLSRLDGDLVLSISDDGIGLPRSMPVDRGLGLRIMASRAGMIGATLSVENKSEGGVIVTCGLPVKSGEVNSQ